MSVKIAPLLEGKQWTYENNFDSVVGNLTLNNSKILESVNPFISRDSISSEKYVDLINKILCLDNKNYIFGQTDFSACIAFLLQVMELKHKKKFLLYAEKIYQNYYNHLCTSEDDVYKCLEEYNNLPFYKKIMCYYYHFHDKKIKYQRLHQLNNFVSKLYVIKTNFFENINYETETNYATTKIDSDSTIHL